MREGVSGPEISQRFLLPCVRCPRTLRTDSQVGGKRHLPLLRPTVLRETIDHCSRLGPVLFGLLPLSACEERWACEGFGESELPKCAAARHLPDLWPRVRLLREADAQILLTKVRSPHQPEEEGPQG